MYVFGRSVADAVCDEPFLKQAFAEARTHSPQMVSQSIESMVQVLDRLSKIWGHGSRYWTRAFEMTKGELPFSDDMISYSLDVIPELLRATNVMARIKADFGSPDKLDRFVRSHAFSGRERAFPLGILFHVSAGNVFLGAIDSLLMGFLTKNVSIVKLSSRNLSFPMLFAESLREVDHEKILSDKFSLIHFPGGKVPLETLIKKEANAIIAWGGEEMILSYKKGLPLGVKFIEYGPKISFQVISRQALDLHGFSQVGSWVAQDIAMWDQAACASPQNLFVENTPGMAPVISDLMDHIELALQKFPFSRGRLSNDEQVEIMKERARAEYNTIMLNGECRDGKDYLLHHDPRPGLRTSPLNRSLIIKTYSSTANLVTQLTPFSRYLQSCSLLAIDEDEKDLITALGGLGVMRFAHLGQVMQAPIGAPHDGKMTLIELTRIVPEEQDGTLEGLVNDAIAHVPFYRQRRDGRFVTRLDEMPLVKGSDIESGSEDKLRHFTRRDAEGGYVFSSGGTSGSPKYTIYTHDEFSQVADLLAIGFRAQGITAGTVVANLFVAGNLWSSFMAVDQALAKIGARVLPIGGLADRDQTLSYIELFKPSFVVGLPTQLVELVRRAQETGRNVSIPSVLYAGEHLNLVARNFMSSVSGTTHFGSAGYASVDAGPIGYQCRNCQDSVHHLFANDVHLEIIAGEAVVTSRIKRAMPIIRLCTGDLVEWITDDEANCACGSPDPRFRLLGRLNSQFHIWGSRIFVEEFEKAIADCGLDGALFQIILKQNTAAQETIELHIDHIDAKSIDQKVLIGQIYNHSKDLSATHPLAWLQSRLLIVPHAPGGIKPVARTGKIKTLLDER